MLRTGFQTLGFVKGEGLVAGIVTSAVARSEGDCCAGPASVEHCMVTKVSFQRIKAFKQSLCWLCNSLTGMAVSSSRVESEICIISSHIRLFYSAEVGEDSSMTGVAQTLSRSQYK